MAFPSSPADEQMTVINNIVYIYDLATNTWTRRGQTSASSADFDTLNVVSTVSSTSTTTGALKIAGGVGVEGAIYAGALYTNNLFYEDGSSFTGTQGEIGYTGSQGIPGENGTSGTNGTDGYAGSKGDIGYTGSAGADGVIGYNGSDGYTGSQGDIGYTGSQGESSFAYDSTPPENPQPGDRWFDAVEGAELVWTNDGDSGQWVEISASGFIGYTGSAGSGGGPKISSVVVTDSSYTNLDDTAVALEGGYVKLIGSGFAAGCQVLLGLTPVSSVTYISETEVRAQLPATAAGTYIIYLVNSDGGTAIRVNAVTFSGTPTWVSGSALAGAADTVISIQLTATDATTFALAAGSTLPSGVSLSSSGLLSGTITGITEETVYNFVINAVDAELQDSPRSFAFTVTSGDQYFNLTTLLLPGSANTFVRDASTNNFAVSIAGDTRPNTFNPYLMGWSNYFDGNGNYLSTPNNAAFALGTQDFCVETWYCPISKAKSFPRIVHSGSAQWVTNDSWALLDRHDDAPTKFSWACYSLGGNSLLLQSSTVVQNNTWYHLAVTRSGSTFRLFVNGVIEATYTNSGSCTSSSTVLLRIGGNTVADAELNGYVSNLRVVKGAAVYTATFTPSTTPLEAIDNTSLLTCQSNRFVDNSVNNFVITHTDDVAVRSFSPFAEPATTGGSTYFDGSDYLSLANNDAFNCGTGDFTLETWYYHDGGTALYPSIFSSTDWATGTGGVGLRFNNTTLANKFAFFWYGVGDPFLSASFTSAPYAWHHVAVTRSGNTFTLWVDGVSAATGTASGTVNFNLSTGGPRIGWGPWDGSNGYLKAYLNNLRLVKGTALYTTAFTPPTQPLTAVSGTSLLTLQNNQPANNSQFLDASSSNFPITRAGNATQGTFSPYSPSGWSNYFDGTGDFLTVGSSTNLALGADNWTVEAWIYPTSVAIGQNIIIDWRSSNNGLPVLYMVNNQVWWRESSATKITSSATLNANTWYHVAVVKVSTTTTMYINGVSVGSYTDTTNYVNADLKVGKAWDTNYWNGYISNLRIVRGTAVYTANFTPSTQPLTAIAGTSLLTCADNRFIDESPNNFAITRNGDTRVTNFSPFKAVVQTPVSYSAYFDGTGDYLSLANNVALQFTADFTIEMWLYPTALSGIKGLFGQRATESNYSPILLEFNGAALTFQVSTSGSSWAVNLASPSLTANTWTHIALVRNSSTVTLYVNGVSAGTGTASGALMTPVAPTYLGMDSGSPSGAGYFPGYISNVRIVKGTAVYTANFTPPTQPLTAIANTSLLTCQSPIFVDNSTNNFAITAAGNSQPTQVNPFGSTFANSGGYTAAEYGGSMYFDGSGDSLVVPANPLTYFSNLPFTMEAWVYPNASNGIIAGRRAAVSARGFYLAYNSSNNFIFWAGDTDVNTWNLQLTSSSTYPLNQWYHVAITRNSSNVFTLWVNGVSVASATASFAIADDTTNLQIGIIDTAGSPFNGYISDLRIAKGTLLYTSNFAPPVAPVEPIQNTVLLLNGTAAAITDATTKNVLETVGDAKISTVQSKFGSSSMYFDGSGDYLQLRGNEPIGTGDFTIEGWFWLGGIADTYYNIFQSGLFGIRYANNGFANRLQISYDMGTVGSIYSCVVQSGNNAYVWAHIAWTRAGGVNKLFFNGNQQNLGTGINPATYPVSSFSNSGNVAAGGSIGSAWLGYIQDFRITRGHARYTANFTPPATAFQTR